MKLSVVDASVALKWVIPDEEEGPAALRLLSAFHSGQVQLIAPSLWEYEVANALKVGVARDRLTEEEGRQAFRSLLELGIRLCPFGPIAHRAWELAVEYRLSVYDAAYVALAERPGCGLHTGDKGLARAVGDAGRVCWIGEFA